MKKKELEKLWEKHLESEFLTKDVNETMKTMVAEPYLIHIPTLAGGIGYEQVYNFYKNDFIGKFPEDVTLIPITRTIGDNRLVDEFVLRFTHSTVINFMLPHIEPTYKLVELPHVAIINFRENKILGEHIYWDQGSLLAQIGILHLPTSTPLCGNEEGLKLISIKKMFQF